MESRLWVVFGYAVVYRHILCDPTDVAREEVTHEEVRDGSKISVQAR